MQNKFVILFEEDYDMYTIDVPYPYVTSNTKEQVESLLWEMADASIFYEEMHENKKRHIERPELKFGSYSIAYYSLWTREYENNKWIHIPRIPRVLTVEEWIREFNINNKESIKEQTI